MGAAVNWLGSSLDVLVSTMAVLLKIALVQVIMIYSLSYHNKAACIANIRQLEETCYLLMSQINKPISIFLVIRSTLPSLVAHGTRNYFVSTQ